MLPQDFITRIQTQFPDKWEKLTESLESEPLTSIRINPRKNAALIYDLSEKNNWCHHGFYLKERPKFTLDPLHHIGAYYVQEASSMFIDYVIKQLFSESKFYRFLDLCAAPGGKSTIILDNLKDDQFLISNEIIPNRNLILRENISKWGSTNVLVSENKPQDFRKLKNYFDFILIDAPCSGEGMFRKDPIAREEWSLKNVEKCAIRQLEILENAWEALADGGVLVYSTCTFARDENELLIQKFSEAGYEFECLDLSVEPSWGIDKIEYNQVIGYQFLPNQVVGEGFFCSVLRKKGDKKLKEFRPSKSYINTWLFEYISEADLSNHSTYKFKNSLFLASNALLDDLTYLQQNLYIKQIGIEIANYKGENLTPNQGLALVNFPIICSQELELSIDQALDYLAKLDVKWDIPQGFTLLTYRDLPLGFISNDKGRIENLYPNGWKIRNRN